jgi:hypothetical protein
MPSSIVVLVAVSGIGGGDGQLGSDLVEGCLGGGESELALEEGRLGGVPVRAGEIESLGRVDELLGLLHDVRQVGEHGFDQRPRRMTRGRFGGTDGCRGGRAMETEPRKRKGLKEKGMTTRLGWNVE